MNKLNQLLILLIIFACSSCSKDEPATSASNFENGVFIINEGNFSSGSGTVDFYNRSTGEVSLGIFSRNNNNEALGSVLQSMKIIGDKAYLVVNNSGKVEIVNLNDFKRESTIEGLHSPRYVHQSSNDHLLITEWGDDGLSGQIARVDINTNEVLNRVPWNGPEQIVSVGDKTYILDNGGFGESNKVSVLNSNLEKIANITVGQKPESVVVDKNGAVWVLSGGSFESYNGASLVRIENDLVVYSEELSFGASDLAINTKGDQLYFYAGGDIMTKEIDNATSTLFYDLEDTQIPYGLGFDPETQNLFVGTTPDYSSASNTLIISENGVLVKTLVTGVATNSFVFK